ncbi:MAG: CvpA family protein [Alphaproteobacteria bacterium]|nr:CvpA family protein [Alphaproteobacteria bacterium]
MNPVDLGVLGAILLCALIALIMGFVRTILALLSWAGAALVTVWGFSYVRPVAREYINPSLLADIAAGLGVFVSALVVFSVVSHLLSSLVRGSPLSFLDRTLGFVLGGVIGAVLVALVWLGASGFMEKEKRPEVLQTARTLPFIDQLAEMIRGFLPPELRGQPREGGDETARKASQAAAFRNALDALSTPSGRPPAQPGETGYKPDDRRRLDNLIDRGQGAAGAPAAGGTTR